MESMWGDWLPKMVADMKAVDPTDAEKEILLKAQVIKAAHKQRLQTVRLKYQQPEE